MCREVTGNDDLIARTREEPRDELQERFEPQYRGWVSYVERPPSKRMFCFLLIRGLFFLFTLEVACQLVAHPVGRARITQALTRAPPSVLSPTGVETFRASLSQLLQTQSLNCGMWADKGQDDYLFGLSGCHSSILLPSGSYIQAKRP